MRNVFRNELLNSEFTQKGFVKIKLLSRNEIKEIKSILKQDYFNQSNLSETLSVSLWSNNLPLKTFADNLIKKFLSEKLKSILFNYEPIWGDILVKKPHIFKTFELHQDWTFVDENEFTSVNVWCPLQHVNYWNGCLQLVPKSHHSVNKIRGLNIIPSYSEIGNSIKKKYGETIEAEAGEVIIFSHALLHASPPNRTLKDRIAIGLNLKPVEAPTLHYYLNIQSNRIEKYIVENDYFIHMGQKVNFADAIKNGFHDYTVDGLLQEEIIPAQHKLSLQDFEKLINSKEEKS